MDAELSRPDWLATVQSGRKQVQSRVCTPGFIEALYMYSEQQCAVRTDSGRRRRREEKTTGLVLAKACDRAVLCHLSYSVYTQRA